MPAHVRIVSFSAAPFGSSTCDKATGAYVNVYALTKNDLLAHEIARREIEAAGWRVTTESEIVTVDEHSFSEESDGRTYYEQCLVDGVVVVFHTWRQEHKPVP